MDSWVIKDQTIIIMLRRTISINRKMSRVGVQRLVCKKYFRFVTLSSLRNN